MHPAGWLQSIGNDKCNTLKLYKGYEYIHIWTIHVLYHTSFEKQEDEKNVKQKQKNMNKE